MPDIPRFPAFNAVAALKKQLNFNETAGTRDPLTGTGATIPKSIDVQKVTQNSDGTWNQILSIEPSPVQDQNSILNQLTQERESTIQSYEDLSAVYDAEILKYNTEINQKKSEIISIITTAVGAGCSYLPGNAANINGVACGIGSTIRQDESKLKIYTNITNYAASNPFSESTQNLSSSNLGKGFENIISNNSGSIVGSNYKSLTGLKIISGFLGGGAGGGATDSDCTTYKNQINSLATEIETLRTNRDQYLKQVNDLKNLKNDQEFRRWGNKQGDAILTTYNNSLKTSINTISQYVDNLVMDGLIVYYDAAENYGIEFISESATGINAITKWNNLAGDGLYATPKTSVYSVNLNTDGPSVELNNYITTTNQYFDIESSFIGSSEIESGDTSYTIETWVKITNDTNLGISSTTNGASIVGISSVHGYGLQVYKPSGIRVSFGERGNGSLVNNSDLQTNTWYHILATNEAGLESKIYINGVLDGTGNPINITTTVSNLQIAYNSVHIQQYFSGKISAIRIYNKNFTGDEVVKNFNAHKERYGY